MSPRQHEEHETRTRLSFLSAAFVIFAIFNPENLVKLETAIADELQKFVKDGVQEKEVEEGIKAYLLAEKNKRAQDEVLLNQLAALTYAGRTYAYLAEREKKVAALTAEEINSAVRQTIKPLAVHRPMPGSPGHIVVEAAPDDASLSD